MSLEDYQLHVVKDVDKERPETFCGAKIPSKDCGIQGASHAKLCVENETWLQPCPRCWQEIEKAST